MSKIAESIEELLKAYLNGKIIVYKESAVWQKKDGLHFPSISNSEIKDKKWSIKDRAININGFEVPEPYCGEMEMEKVYWYPQITEGSAEDFSWKDDATDRIIMESGMLRLTKEAAELHLQALLSFTKQKQRG